MKRIEALADAISAHNGYNDPTSLFYKLRNPGALKPFLQRHKKDFTSGYRSFDSHLDGYRALINDLKVKIAGNSAFGVSPASPLIKVLPLFEVPILEGDFIYNYINKALNVDGVTSTTTLAFFQE